MIQQLPFDTGGTLPLPRFWLSYAKLLYWRQKLESDSSETTEPTLVAVEVVADAPARKAEAAKFDVWLTSGMSLEVHAPTDAGRTGPTRLGGGLGVFRAGLNKPPSCAWSQSAAQVGWVQKLGSPGPMAGGGQDPYRAPALRMALVRHLRRQPTTTHCHQGR